MIIVYHTPGRTSFHDMPGASLIQIQMPDRSAIKFVRIGNREEALLFSPSVGDPRVNIGRTALAVLRKARAMEDGFSILHEIDPEARKLIADIERGRKAGRTLAAIAADAGRTPGWASYWLDRGEGRR